MIFKLQIQLLVAVVMAFSTSTGGAYRVRRAPVDRTGSGSSGQQGGGTSLEGTSHGWLRTVNSKDFQEEAFVGTNQQVVRMRSLVSEDGYVVATVLYDFESFPPIMIVQPGGYYKPCFVYSNSDSSWTYDSLSTEIRNRDGQTVSSASSLSLEATGEPLTEEQKTQLFNANPMIQAVCGYPDSRLILMMSTPSASAPAPTEPTVDVEFFTATSDITLTVLDRHMQ